MRSNGVLEHARVLGNATNDDPFARASERAGNRNLKPDREIMKAPGATERLTEGEHVRMIFEHSLPIFSNRTIIIFYLTEGSIYEHEDAIERILHNIHVYASPTLTWILCGLWGKFTQPRFHSNTLSAIRGPSFLFAGKKRAGECEVVIESIQLAPSLPPYGMCVYGMAAPALRSPCGNGDGVVEQGRAAGKVATS